MFVFPHKVANTSSLPASLTRGCYLSLGKIIRFFKISVLGAVFARQTSLKEIGQTVRFYQFPKYVNNRKHSSGKRTLPSLQARSRRIPLGKFMANFLLSVFQPHSANQGNPYHCQASGPHCTQQLLDLHFLFGVICAFYMLYFPGPQIRASGTANPFPVVTSRFQNANKPSKTEKNTISNGQKMKKTRNLEQSFCIYKKKLDFKL